MQGRKFRISLGLFDDQSDRFLERFITSIASVFQPKLEAANGSQPLNCRWIQHDDVRILDLEVLFIQLLQDGTGVLIFLFPLFPIFQNNEACTDRRPVKALDQAKTC